MNANSSYKIFITYRHEDSQATCDHIYDRLRMRFGRETVFKDVDAIPSGSSFPGVIDNALQKCRVVLVVIGPSWSTVGETKGAYAGQARLNNPEDWVRIEVERALSLAPVNSVGDPASGLLLIPLLVQGASMPLAENLPESLRDLTRRNFIRIRPDPDFNRDIQRLITRIAKWMRPIPLSRRKLLLGAGAIAAAATGIGVGIRLTTSRNSPPVIPGTLRWRFPTSVYVASSLAVANGMVYVGAGDGTVYALDAHTGSNHWNYATGSRGTSSPVVANGLVYVGTWLSTVYVFNAHTGEKLWSFEAANSWRDYAADWPSSIAVADGVIFLNASGGIIYALDARSGAKRWSFDTGGELYLPPIAVGNQLYVNTADGSTLYALDAHTGEKQWSYQTENGVSAPAVAGGLVYVGSGDGVVYELNAALGTSQTSIVIYRLGTDDPETTGPEELWPTMIDGVLYVSSTNVGSSKGFVYALGGEASWSFQADGKVTVTSPPTVANGTVYIGVHRKEGDGTVYALNAHTGAKEWSYKTNGGVNLSPVVANGMVYVGAEDGYVYALNV